MRIAEALNAGFVRLVNSPRKYGIHAGQTLLVVGSCRVVVGGHTGYRTMIAVECEDEHVLNVPPTDLRPVA